MKKENIIKIGLFMIAGLFLFSLLNRVINIDDAWLGEHAYWMSKVGYVKSELMRGITNQEVRILWHHKLLTWQGALFIKIFGFSVYSLKLVPLVYLVLFLTIYYFNFFKKIFSPTEFYLSLIILLSNAWVFEHSFVFRPEVLLMTLGFLSYLLLDKVLKDKKNQILFTILSGLLAGLCVLTHLNGIIFPIAGFFLLLWNRKFALSFLFGLSTLPTIAFYFFDFTSTYNLSYWYYQLNETPAHDRVTNLPFGLYYLQNLLNEHLRFFHSPIEISFTLFFAGILTFAYRKLKAYKNLLRYTGLLALFLAVFSVHKASYYIIIYLPYLIILMILSFRVINESDKTLAINRRLLYISYILLFVYLTINVVYDVHVTTDKSGNDKNKEVVSRYIKDHKDSCRIVAPMMFMFNEILHYKSIQGEMCYTEMQKNNKNIYKEGFLQQTKKFDIDYIILSQGSVEKLGVNKLSDEDLLRNNCEILLRSDQLYIIKNLKSKDNIRLPISSKE